MGSSSQLSVDYFDSEASLTEAMFPPKRVQSELTRSSLTESTSAPSTSSYSASVTSSSASSSSSFADAEATLPLAPPNIDFGRIAAVIEEARKAVSLAAPFIQSDASGEVAALLEAFTKHAAVFRDAFGDLAIQAPSEVEVSCSVDVPEEFSIEEVSAATWALDQTSSTTSDSQDF